MPDLLGKKGEKTSTGMFALRLDPVVSSEAKQNTSCPAWQPAAARSSREVRDGGVSVVRKNVIYLSDDQLQALAVTAAAGNFSLEDLVAVAAWAFAREEESFKNYYIREVWCKNASLRPETRQRRSSMKEKLHGLARCIGSFFS